MQDSENRDETGHCCVDFARGNWLPIKDCIPSSELITVHMHIGVCYCDYTQHFMQTYVCCVHGIPRPASPVLHDMHICSSRHCDSKSLLMLGDLRSLELSPLPALSKYAGKQRTKARISPLILGYPTVNFASGDLQAPVSGAKLSCALSTLCCTVPT